MKKLKTEYLDINLFANEEVENYYKPVRISNFWSKTISVEEYLNKIKPYLKDILNNLKNSDT